MKASVTAKPSKQTQVVLVSKIGAEKIPDFTGEAGTIATRYEGSTTFIFAGCGDKPTTRSMRSAAAEGIRTAGSLKRSAVSVVPPVEAKTDPLALRAVAEGALLGAYVFDRYKTEKPFRISSIEFVSDVFPAKETKNLVLLTDAIFFARDLINGNASDIHPAALAAEASKIAKSDSRYSLTVLTEKEISAQGLGLLKAVGQGSVYPPRLIVIEYKGAPKSSRKIAIVGKGVTFDSGGQNLKPGGSIENMREDMSGAATTLATLKLASELSLPVNLVGVIPAANNAIDGGSYFPGDIYKSYSGKTVEILNTDAEGRLILADAISYCIKKYRPTEIIDIATLTGAIVTALGSVLGGLFSNNDELANAIIASGERSGERFWRMPVFEEHVESMKSDIADLRNMSKMKKGAASSSTAAGFLQCFVEDIPWAHLDIAGMAWNEGEASGELSKYGVGFGVRLLIDYLSTSGKGLR